VVVATTRTNRSASALTVASIAATEKLEQLRALTWGYDPAGLPVSDGSSDLTVAPEAPFGGPGLSPSPADALQQDRAGYCDFLDARGQPVGGQSGVHYIRRWSIQPSPAGGADVLAIQVVVQPRSGQSGASLPGHREQGEVRLVTLKARKTQ
jgi:hypothetical protein